MKNVKVNSDVELKDRLVAINRVTKVSYRRHRKGCRGCQEESGEGSRVEGYHSP